MSDQQQAQPPRAMDSQLVIRPLPPSAAPPVVPDLYARIGVVRDAAVRHFGAAQKLTQTAAVIMLVICFLNLIALAFMVVAAAGGGMFGGASTPAGVDMLLLVSYSMFALLLLALAVYSVRVLTDLPRLFARHYELTWLYLHQTSLPLMIAQEDYWLRIQQRLNTWTVLKREGHSIYRTLEEHLSYCACHRDTLLAISHGAEQLPYLKLSRSQQCYASQKLFQQQTWVYWVSGCLLFLFLRIGVIAAAAIVIIGSRYVISRAALVAYCDFLVYDEQVTDMQQAASE